MTTVKRGRGRPKGSKNKPKTDNQPKRKRGRPKGSKNKPKIDTTPKKRGRPRKNPIGSIKFANLKEFHSQNANQDHNQILIVGLQS